MSINFTSTAFTVRNATRPAIFVSYGAAEDFLGRPHDGNPEDDLAICAALVAAGAVVSAGALEDGALDEDGLYYFTVRDGDDQSDLDDYDYRQDPDYAQTDF